MAKDRNRDFWESARFNNWSFKQYYNRLVELSTSMFDWKNVPDTIDVRFLELALFSDGKAVFFKDEVMGYLALRVAINGPLDVYRNPINRRAYADNGYNKRLTKEDSVIIWNNYIRTNSALDVELFSKRLYNIDRAIDVNTNAQKTPILITCEESQRLTMKNLYMQYDGNAPVIYGDKNLNPNAFKVLSTQAPFVAQELYTLKTQLWNEALTYLGINNVNITKKERLISDEVKRNQGGTVASRYSRLEMRRKACDEINKMFGLDMWVDYREDTRLEDDFLYADDIEGELENQPRGDEK